MGGSDKDGKHVDGFGYYETIAGGSGAGPDWQGTDGVHVAMTNTRATDVETLERNYPVVLRRFEIRDGSGGVGRNRGGNGVTKELQFLTPQMQVSILSERRVYHPFGLEGGGDAQCGRNTWIKHELDKDGETQVQKRINLGGKVSRRNA
jgi:5-oxoprolinase (ATP-hydrolysing)